jgi:hypothetical protein
MNTDAIECSRPSATKQEIGRRTPRNFEPHVFALIKETMAEQTSALQKMPRVKIFMKGRDVLAAATDAGAGDGGTPAADARPRIITQPRQLPRKLEIQTFVRLPKPALFSNTAAGTSAVMPVKSGAPDMSVSIRPIGSPMEPRMMRCRPGLEDAISGTEPPTVKASRPPVPMKKPAGENQGFRF